MNHKIEATDKCWFASFFSKEKSKFALMVPKNLLLLTEC